MLVLFLFLLAACRQPVLQTGRRNDVALRFTTLTARGADESH